MIATELPLSNTSVPVSDDVAFDTPEQPQKQSEQKTIASSMLARMKRHFSIPKYNKSKSSKKKDITAATAVSRALEYKGACPHNMHRQQQAVAPKKGTECSAAQLSGTQSSIPTTIEGLKKEQKMKKNREGLISDIDCMTPVVTNDITFDMVDSVIRSWEQKVRQVPNWKEIGGELFLRKTFELDPETITILGFPADTKHDDPALKKDEKFMQKGIRLIEAIDVAIGILGPDLEPLEGTLFALGTRHVARQCRPCHWDIVGAALFYVLEACLQEEFTPRLRECWATIYNFMGYHMIRGLLAHGTQK